MDEKRTATTLPEAAEWDDSLGHILRDMKGAPINVHKLMARHPKLLTAWWNFRCYSVAGGDLGQRRAELVILRVAVHLGSWYEWASHVDRSLACGLTLDEVARVKTPDTTVGWCPAEAALLRAVDELLATRGLERATYDDLGRHFDDRQIMDIVAIHGMYIILGCMLSIWPLEVDPPVAARLPAGITPDTFRA